MKKHLPLFVAAVLLLLAAPALAATAQEPPSVGKAFPDIRLKGTMTDGQRAYLGLPAGGDSHPLTAVDADLVLVEVFNMYCPHCQKEAPGVNEMHRSLLASPHKDKLKILGVGAGNSQFEVDFFRQEYKVDLPLFEDGDYAVYQRIGQVGTPCFFLVRLPKDKGGEPEVLMVHEGEFGDPGAFLKRILNKAGL